MPANEKEAALVPVIRVGGFEIPVEVVDDPDEIGTFINHPNRKIQVIPGMARRQHLSTILHEGIEAINDTYGIRLKERQILALEASLLAFVEQNGELIDAIREGKR